MLDALILPRRFFIVACSLLCFSFSLADESAQIRVLSYNIHHGAGVDGKLDLERIAKVIATVKPDIVALQEVDKNAKRSGSVDQATELAKLCELNVAFGANIPLQGGQYGNAILSRFPIREHENYKLPNFDGGEQRGVLIAEIAVPNADTPLVFFATHLDHRRGDRERIASAEFINTTLKKYSKQFCVLAGDLNDVIGSETLRQLDSSWQRTNETPMPTIPVGEPTRQIDFILYRPAKRGKPIETQVLPEKVASDHRAILSVIELRP